MKPCRLCGEPIRLSAHKCIHCNSWQNPLGEWSTVLTTALPLLVALLSVTIAAVPIVTNALTPKKSILSSVFQAESSSYISALVSNSGGRAGSINSAELEIPPNKHKTTVPLFIEFTVVTSDDSGAMVVPPGNSVLVRFRPIRLSVKAIVFKMPLGSFPITFKMWKSFEDSFQESLLSVPPRDCTVRFNYSNFDGSQSASAESINCVNVFDFLQALPHDAEETNPPSIRPN